MAVERLIPLPQSTLSQINQYRLVRSLGAGGMGVVYEAFHLRLRKRVALKVLSPHLALEADAVDRFEREMAAIGQLSHPNIVHALDAGSDGTTHYLVMEYVDGANLEAICRQACELRIPDACEIVRQAALGLAHAHAFGIVHRDIKPSNLLLSSSGQVKITDLGLARFHGPSDEHSFTSVGDILGSYDYMSPEQAAGEKVGPASDIYSLGATLFRMLAGTPVFSGPHFASPAAKMLGHQQALPTRLSELRPSVPQDIDELVQRMLAKNPADRPESMAKVTDVLERHVQHAGLQGLVAPGVPPAAMDITTQSMYSAGTQPVRPRTAGQWSPARRGIAVAAGIVAVGLLLWLNVAGVSKSRATRERILIGKNSELNQWYPVLDEPPTSVIWPPGALSAVHPDTAAQSLTVSCAEIGVLSFGRIQVSSYRLRIDMHQNLWQGHAGIVIGLRDDPDKPGGYVAQGLMFDAASIPGQPPRMYMRRALLSFVPLPDGDFRLQRKNHYSAEIGLPEGPVQSFEVEIAERGLSHVRWGGDDVSGLCTSDINNQFQDADYRGELGLLLLESDLTVSGAQLMVRVR